MIEKAVLVDYHDCNYSYGTYALAVSTVLKRRHITSTAKDVDQRGTSTYCAVRGWDTVASFSNKQTPCYYTSMI